MFIQVSRMIEIESKLANEDQTMMVSKAGSLYTQLAGPDPPASWYRLEIKQLVFEPGAALLPGKSLLWRKSSKGKRHLED